jgi:6-phosphogluconolactonase
VIHIFDSTDELAASLSEKVINLAGKSIQAGSPFNIALSGGSTPGVLFKKMASSIGDPGLWEQVHFFWVDERCVPPDHPESNYRMTDEAFFHPLSISHAHVYRMMGEEEPHAEAIRYEGLLRSSLPARDGLPLFDLILLGMGTDGHTASIFPDQMPIMFSERICEVARHPETRQHRITLTGHVINNAARVCFMITGENKAAVLASILDGEEGSEKFPAAHIKPLHGKMEWYLDQEAAQLMHRRSM